ncbi:MAG: response regulator transcription factor [Chloroflexota bacterium]
MEAHRILIVDDEDSIRDFLRLGLRREGFDVLTSGNGLGGLSSAETQRPDLIILDVMLPLLDGLEVCRRLRSVFRTAGVPILMLTARDDVDDRVAGLNAGADDYLVKPFALKELVARVRALLRRQNRDGERGTVLTHGGVLLDRQAHEVSRDGRGISLTAREFELLALLLANAGRVLTREIILEKVWGYDFEGESNVIDVYTRYLRQKLGPPNLIQAIRGVGFVFRV